MYYFFILPALFLYPLLTYKITREVWKKTKNKRFTFITLAVFLLIPTWDVAIGYGIFLYKWATWSETKIYKTVESEEMYFEGEYSIVADYGIVAAEYHFEKGYRALETLVDTDWRGRRRYKDRDEKIKPILYRCTYDSDTSHYYKHSFQRVKCSHVEKPISKYKVSKKKSTFWITENISNTISDMETGKVLGYARSVSIKYLVIAGVPFFNWLDWHDRLYWEMSSNKRAYELEYEIIKPLVNTTK